MTTIQIICLVVVALLALLGGFLLVKKSKEHCIRKWIALIALTAILVCSCIFWKTNFELMSSIIVLYFAILAGYFIVTKSEKHDLVKWIGLFILVSIALTWIFAYGYFNGGEFIDYGMNEQGLTDIPNLLYYSLNFAGDKIVYLLALGAFYAVLSRSDGYKKIVTSIASKFEGKEIVFSLFVSLLLTLMTILFSQTFIVLIFVPFLISILLNMKLDKLSAFAVTFGSILVGNIGILYGGEGLYWFTYYTQTTIKTALLYRLIVLLIAFVLFNLFTVLHIKKIKKNNYNEEVVDPFAVTKPSKDVRSLPIVVILCLVFILMILGYVGWSAYFNINVFNKFHEWLFNLKIGEFAIFKVLLGTLAKEAPFGGWTLFHASLVLLLGSIIVSLISRIKLDEFIDAYGEGFKKIAKPLALFIGIYMVMVANYMSPYLPTIANMICNGVTKFNVYLVSFVAFLSSVFNVDFGFTGYSVAPYFIATYAANIDVIHIVFTSLYGFACFFVPTSAILIIGLSYLDIKYKTWFKYIWMFLLAMLIVLLALYTILVYI